MSITENKVKNETDLLQTHVNIELICYVKLQKEFDYITDTAILQKATSLYVLPHLVT